MTLFQNKLFCLNLYHSLMFAYGFWFYGYSLWVWSILMPCGFDFKQGKLWSFCL